MNTKLSNINIIQKEKLDPAHYLQSLLEQSYALKLISDTDLEQIQLHSIETLSKQLELYTKGESSSIRTEVAQDIMESFLYCIGLFMKYTQTPEESLENLKNFHTSELYFKSKPFIQKYVLKTRTLYDTVSKNCLPIQNIAYHETVFGPDAIPSFFKQYNMEFGAHNTISMIDYPLCFDNMDTVGVEYIYNFLKKLYFENEFCKNFSLEEIKQLLYVYDKNNNELLINFFSLIATQSAGSILLGKNPLHLNISKQEKQHLEQLFSSLSTDDFNKCFHDLEIKMINEFHISNNYILKSLHNVISDLSTLVSKAMTENKLDSIFLTLDKKIEDAHSLYNDGNSMIDEQFKLLTETIRNCTTVDDKIQMIKQKVTSFSDLVDILGAYCIFENEFVYLFDSLGEIEIAMLAKKSPLCNINTNILKHADAEPSEHEKEWQNWLNTYLEQINEERFHTITQYINDINML